MKSTGHSEKAYHCTAHTGIPIPTCQDSRSPHARILPLFNVDARVPNLWQHEVGATVYGLIESHRPPHGAKTGQYATAQVQAMYHVP